MDGLNIKQYCLSQTAGVILNEWQIYRYDKDGYAKSEQHDKLALTYGADGLQLILLTNGDDYVPGLGDIDAWRDMLADIGEGDIAQGARVVRGALDWARDNLDCDDCNDSEFYDTIELMRELTDEVILSSKHDDV